MTWLAYALIGSTAGFLAGYLGIGGGLVLVPALAWLFTQHPGLSTMAVHTAVATSLATMLFTSLSSVVAHHRAGAIDWRVTRTLTPGLLAGAVSGGLLAGHLSSDHLAAAFGGFALVAGLHLASGREVDGQRSLPGSLPMTFTGYVIGGISSLVGIGGGSMTVPWLLWHGCRAPRAVATAAACGYPIALAGTVMFIAIGPAGGDRWVLGYVHLPALVGVVLFSVATAPLGARLVHRSRPVVVRRVFGAFLLLVAARMLA